MEASTVEVDLLGHICWRLCVILDVRMVVVFETRRVKQRKKASNSSVSKIHEEALVKFGSRRSVKSTPSGQAALTSTTGFRERLPSISAARNS